jgi:hypothetical protein
MKKTRTGLTTTKALMAGAALITLSAGITSGANAASGTGAASAIILTPITVTGAALHFGSVTDSGAGGTVVVTSAGVRSVGGATTAVTGGGLEQNGTVTVTAANNAAINLTMAATAITITSGPNTMAVNTFHVGTVAAGPGPIASTLVGTTGAYGIGATLVVGAAQVAGTYTGTYTVNVNYQ